MFCKFFCRRQLKSVVAASWIMYWLGLTINLANKTRTLFITGNSQSLGLTGLGLFIWYFLLFQNVLV